MATQKQILAAQEFVSTQSSGMLESLGIVIFQTLLNSGQGKKLWNFLEIKESNIIDLSNPLVIAKVRVGKSYYKNTIEKWVTPKKKKQNRKK